MDQPLLVQMTIHWVNFLLIATEKLSRNIAVDNEQTVGSRVRTNNELKR